MTYEAPVQKRKVVPHWVHRMRLVLVAAVPVPSLVSVNVDGQHLVVEEQVVAAVVYHALVVVVQADLTSFVIRSN